MENAFKSEHQKPIQRALSQWLHDAFDGKIITPTDYIEHFGITEVIKKLSAEVRGQVFCTCNGGGDPKRAAKMNSEIVASTIESMRLDKLVTDADICKDISTDHMVEVMSSQELYRLLFGKPGEQKAWLNDKKKSESSKQFMAQVHAVIQAESLLGNETYASYIKELGIDKIVHEKTPPMLLALGQVSAFEKNSAKELFTPADFLGIYTPAELVKYVDLDDLFPVVEAVARLNSWIDPVVVPKPAALPDGVITPSELPPPPKSGDDEPEMSVEGSGADGEELTLDMDDVTSDDDKTQVLQRESVEPKPPKQQRRAR